MIKSFVFALGGYAAATQLATPTIVTSPTILVVPAPSPPAPSPPAPPAPRHNHVGHAQFDLGNGASITITQDPKLHVRVRWESAIPPQIAAVIKSLGPPTSGACWLHCTWGERASLTVHNTRTVNYETFEWHGP